MRKLLLFSGGFDSTLLLADLVSNANEKEDTITAFSFYYGITGESKLRREWESQLLILRELKRLYPKVNLKHEIIEIKFDYGREYLQNVKGLTQPIFWITNIIPFLENGDKVYLGYIREDQAILQENNIYDLFNAANRIQENKDINLNFPLKYYDKCDVIKNLIINYPSLLEYCISCENAGYAGLNVVCGECTPCVHLKQALVKLSATHYDSKISDKANQLLKDLFKIKVSITTIDETKEEEDEKDCQVETIPCDTIDEVKES